MCWINLCALSWEAAATLFTGLLAVAAAMVVGIRQTDLAAAATKVELFERRYASYQAADQFLTLAQVNIGQYPTGNVEHEFRMARSRAPFLFDEAVAKNLDSVAQVVGRFVMLHSKNEALIRRGALQQADIDREHAALTAIAETQRNLSSLFGDHLNLGDDLRPFLTRKRR